MSSTLRHHDACRIVSPPALPNLRQNAWLATHNRTEGGFGMKRGANPQPGTVNMKLPPSECKKNKA
jgi:hypothetical protein